MSKRYCWVFARRRSITTLLQIVMIVSAIGGASLPSPLSLFGGLSHTDHLSEPMRNVLAVIAQPLQRLGGEPKVAKAAPATQTVTTVGLHGTGAALLSPEIVVSSSSLNFGNVELGDVVTRTLTISNTGTAPLLMTSISLGGTNVLEFNALSGTCGLLSVSLAAGNSCTIRLTFHPSLLGSLTSTLSILSNDLDELITSIPLSGTGIPIPAPEIVISSNSLDFGDVELGDVLTRTITISNTGDAALLMTSVSLGGADVAEFSALNGTCGLASVSLAAGNSCTIGLTFHPSILGVLTTTLSIVSNDLDELLNLIDLSGNGIPVPAPEIVISSNSLDFGDVELGDVLTRTITISNTGDAALLMTSISLGGADVAEFSALNGTCGLVSVSLAAGNSCTIGLTFHPSILGVLTTTLSIVSNDLDELLNLIDLSGNGIPIPAPEIEVSSTNLNFGTVDVGSVATQTITLSNTGNAPLLISSIIISGTNALEFTITGGTCGLAVTTLAPGESCNVQLLFHPLTAGTKEAELVILNNDPSESAFRITFIGNGNSPAPSELTVQINTPIAGDDVVNRSEAPAVLLSGRTQPQAKVMLELDDGNKPAVKANTTADAAGNYRITLNLNPLMDGSIEVRAVAMDGADKESAPAVQQIQKDTIVLAPVMLTPAQDEIVQTKAVAIRGEGEVGAVVTVLIAGQTLTSTVDAMGAWHVLTNELNNSAYTPQLSITDAAGNQADFIDGHTFTVDVNRVGPGTNGRIVYLPLIQQ